MIVRVRPAADWPRPGVIDTRVEAEVLHEPVFKAACQKLIPIKSPGSLRFYCRMKHRFEPAGF